ncbi:MAG: hypothetical protein ABII82_05860 [Verrucomicrobiota bacterium]
MNEFAPYGVARLAELMAVLGDAGVAANRRQAGRPRTPATGSRGRTLRPGNDTELWNALADHIEPMLADYGAKANLARVLDVPRQRIHDYFVGRTQMPDAERLLHLLGWLVTRTDSRTTGVFPKPVA